MGTLTPLVNSLYSIKQKPLLRGGGEPWINGLGDEALLVGQGRGVNRGRHYQDKFSFILKNSLRIFI
jgi:hypothetical protein